MRVKSSANKCKFANLRAGDAFYYEGTLYMKVHDCGEYRLRNAVYLETGTLIYISEDTSVEVAKVHIEDDEKL